MTSTAQTYSRYHPSKDYWWHFKDQSFNQGSRATQQNQFQYEIQIYY